MACPRRRATRVCTRAEVLALRQPHHHLPARYQTSVNHFSLSMRTSSRHICHVSNQVVSSNVRACDPCTNTIAQAHTRGAPASAAGAACGVASSSLSSMIIRRLAGRAAPTSGLLPQVSRVGVGCARGACTRGGVRARFVGRPVSGPAAPLACAGCAPLVSCEVRTLSPHPSLAAIVE